MLLRLSLSEQPSQFPVELPIRVKVQIHESSHHISLQRSYLLTITAWMNLDPLPGTMTPSRRSTLHLWGCDEDHTASGSKWFKTVPLPEGNPLEPGPPGRERGRTQLLTSLF